MKLYVEAPNQAEQRLDWIDEIKETFDLTYDEITRLEAHKIVWRGDTAFSLEEN